MAGGFGFGQGLPFGEGGGTSTPPSPAPFNFGAAVAAARGSLLVGTGFLVIDGVFVAFLKDVEYYSNVSMYDHVLGKQGGRVESRIPTVVEAGLKIGYADIVANAKYFLLSADNYVDGALADHTAVFTILQTKNTITFPKCNIMPNGSLHLTAAGAAGANLEIRSSRQTLPVFS